MNWEDGQFIKYNVETCKPKCPICGQDGENYSLGGQSCDCHWEWDENGFLKATLNEDQRNLAAEEFYASFT